MEERFQRGRVELESECQISANLFSRMTDRLEAFLVPYLSDFRREQRIQVSQTMQGLCSGLERKNHESLAYLCGLDRKAIQHFVGEVDWDDKAERSALAEQIGRQLSEEDGVIVFDPSAFPKKGAESVGVARQWCGHLGKIDNCQVGVYLVYVTSKGHVLVDGELFLPREWARDRWRLKAAGVPKSRWRHRTRHELCLEMLDIVKGRICLTGGLQAMMKWGDPRISAGNCEIAMSSISLLFRATQSLETLRLHSRNTAVMGADRNFRMGDLITGCETIQKRTGSKSMFVMARRELWLLRRFVNEWLRANADNAFTTQKKTWSSFVSKIVKAM